VCNYCRNFKPETFEVLGEAALEEELVDLRKIKGKHNCILMFSGGRDSSYAMHVVKKELGLKPLAFTYDWGVLTELGRRNQSRMCAKLGVEHVLLSADINAKREYVRQNVNAWMKRPHLGMVGLFMAGDKAFYYYVYQLMQHYKLPVIYSGQQLEFERFKAAYTGIKPSEGRQSKLKQVHLASFFAGQMLKNPSYINASMWDSMKAFFYYYTLSHKVYEMKSILLFNYLPWDEKAVERTLIDEYDWEIATDTPTTWRIGDGTAALYNYIYNTVVGFTESDPFRSNQVRLGVLTRDEALRLAKMENKPRFESLLWYCDVIGLDMERLIKCINNIPKHYERV